ncbi:MAG TPA: nucleotidyltransferase domain-containing protein [Gaiellaceae bacterium]|nr:nucleotidyltransferase domain-containing protein [Gaiellaceae bacterium]
MSVLAEASLSDAEHRVLERLGSALEAEFGSRLRSVWLYGSRARGEEPHPESDVDLLVVLDRSSMDDDHRVYDIVWSAAEKVGVSPVLFSTLVYDVDRIAQRREIRSFFIQEVDRDKIVLFGEP